ncbi:DEAD/DEAH box helicase [Rufibacter soli]
MERAIRLKQASNALGISATQIVEYLNSIGNYIENKPTTKLSIEHFQLIINQFGEKISNKEELYKDLAKPVESQINRALPPVSNYGLLKRAFSINKDGSVNQDVKSDNQNSTTKSLQTKLLQDEVVKSHKDLDQRTIWDKYILAQERILDYQALPIAVKPEYEISESGKLKIEVDQDIFKAAFASDIRKVFNLKEEEFSFDHGSILQSVEITKHIQPEKLIKLRDDAKKFYINFNENPVIEGEITTKENLLTIIETITGETQVRNKSKNKGILYLTTHQREQLDKHSSLLSFESCIGAVYQLRPSLSYYISRYYKNSEIEANLESESVIVKNGELHPNLVNKLHNEIKLKFVSYQIEFQIIADYDISTNQEINNRYKLNFNKGAGSLTPSANLPVPAQNTFLFELEAPTNEEDFDINLKYTLILKTLKRYYNDYEIKSNYKTKYSFEKWRLNSFFKLFDSETEQFWRNLYSTIHGDELQISQSSNTVSFDFETTSELNSKLEKLKAVKHLELIDYGDNHKFKYKVKFKNDLPDLASKLKQSIPSLTTRILSYGSKLHFRFFYKTGNRQIALAIVNDVLETEINSNKYSYSVDNLFKEKYICEENFDLKVEEETEKLTKLKGREFFIGDKKGKKSIGTLRKVSYPKLEFLIEEGLPETVEALEQHKLRAVTPDLKGDRDKIARLRETMLKLQSKDPLPNDNVKRFLFDSSKAKPIQDIELILNSNSSEWQDFEKHIYSKSLNDSQKQAVFKSLKGEELVLIQGPPGTGKSTAIAEIIWQHVRVNQKERLLLTSETNLAVDNAIDKLKNPNHNLVKPVRFGSDEKLESEGLFYSLAEMDRWVEGLSENNNAIRHWLNNIASRINNYSNESAPLERWKQHLTKPQRDTKSLFKSTYIKFANVIGATGSSIGFKNSEGNWTGFYRSYLQIVAGDNYFEKAKKGNFEIKFDTVVMDEASKATPPELALPLIYAKKSIIVGDHRQLPPLLDGEEIKEKLLSIGEFELAKTLSRKEFEISQFERLFLNIDSSIKGTFNTQYRMHPAINEVIKQFYIQDGGLKCGLPLTEEGHKSFESPFSRYHGLSNGGFLLPHIHTVWVDVQEPEMLEGTSRINYGEIDAIKRVLDSIKSSDGYDKFTNWLQPQPLEEKQIGIVSFYGKQIKLLNQLAEEYKDNLPIRVSTVDRFQGMERNIIIVSMVRSNTIATHKDQLANYEIYPLLGYPTQESLGFAESPNRLNVALSRARRLLVIVGNSQHFCKKPIYRNVYDSIKNSPHGLIVDYKHLSNYLVAQNGTV